VEELNVQGLKRLLNDGVVVRTLLSYVANNGDVSVTTVEELNSILNKKGIALEHHKQVKLLQQLAKLGCGDYRNGRKNHHTRIMWRSLQRIGDVVKESLEETDVRETKEEGDARKQSTLEGIRGKMLSHVYPLRPDLPVEFSLPENLTQVEASRLARHIEPLPFSQGSVA